MPFLRASTGAAILCGVIAVAAVASVVAETIDERSDMHDEAAMVTGGDPLRGESMFIQYGCGSCHGLKHVRKATGAVGPPLDGIAIRAMIAGKLPNNPANLEHWIRDPQTVTPGTDMPDLNVGEQDARDITAFLYTRAE